jgi:hypothetical protein
MRRDARPHQGLRPSVSAMTSNCHPRSRRQASWGPRAPRAAERAGSFGITSGWCSGGQVLPQRRRHVARSTLETKALAQPDRGRSQRAECGDIDRLAVHHARLEHLCLHGGRREGVWDAQIPGLGVRVTDTGAKSFVLVVRYPGSSSPSPRALGAYAGGLKGHDAGPRGASGSH